MDNYIYDALSYSPVTDEGDFDFASLVQSMKEAGIAKASALSRVDLSFERIEQYLEKIKSFPSLNPVISINPKEINSTEDLKNLQDMGAVAIKLHPRFADFSIKDPEVKQILQAATKINLPVMLCSYYWGSKDSTNFYTSLTKILEEHSNLKLMLMHGGGVELLKYIELARSHQNLCIDLSFTLSKYKSSSVDLDIQFAFNNFDRRIVIGSDYPDFDHNELKQRFLYFSANLSAESKDRIAHKNAEEFLGLI